MTGTLAAGARLGAYEILALVGAGVMGEVYKSPDTRLDRSNRSPEAKHWNLLSTLSAKSLQHAR